MTWTFSATKGDMVWKYKSRLRTNPCVTMRHAILPEILFICLLLINVTNLEQVSEKQIKEKLQRIETNNKQNEKVTLNLEKSKEEKSGEKNQPQKSDKKEDPLEKTYRKSGEKNQPKKSYKRENRFEKTNRRKCGGKRNNGWRRRKCARPKKRYIHSNKNEQFRDDLNFDVPKKRDIYSEKEKRIQEFQRHDENSFREMLRDHKRYGRKHGENRKRKNFFNYELENIQDEYFGDKRFKEEILDKWDEDLKMQRYGKRYSEEGDKNRRSEKYSDQ